MTLTEVSMVTLAVSVFGKAALDYASDKKKTRQLDHIQKVGDDTHTLSNSAMGVALKDNSISKHAIYILSKRIAELTGDLADRAAVELAQAAWVASEKFASKHEAQQSEVDKKTA